MRIVRDSKPIASLDDWATHAPPKSAGHWVDGRSAKELARAWCGSDGTVVPGEVVEALRSHRDLEQLRIIEMSPEARIRFDKRRGEPRNADLAGFAEDGNGKAVVHVEGKADETFGQRVDEVRRDAEAKLARNEPTGAAARLSDLISALVPSGTEASAGALRYQLLTATAGVLAHARDEGATKAVLIVHEFVSDKTTSAKHDVNATDLEAFVKLISAGTVTSVGSGTAVGPILVSGKPLVDQAVPLYIVKAVRDVRIPA